MRLRKTKTSLVFLVHIHILLCLVMEMVVGRIESVSEIGIANSYEHTLAEIEKKKEKKKAWIS